MTTALFLLGLFVIIHAVKIVHTHSDNDFHGANDAATFKHVCPICDYHFVKDGDADTAYFDIKAPVAYYSFNILPAACYFFAAADTALLRGPPAIV